MRKYLIEDEWNIIERGFEPENHKASESIFSLGNGHMGQRANFEEQYSGDSLQGSYVAGIYYPDKTRVGWWKNGYPEYFAKVLNATNWIGIDVQVEGEPLDLARVDVDEFERVLNMREGYLERRFTAAFDNGNRIAVQVRRFLSMAETEIGAIRYEVTPLNFDGTLSFTPYVDGDVINEDANYDEKFWDEVSRKAGGQSAFVTTRTKKLDFHLCVGMQYQLKVDGSEAEVESRPETGTKYAAQHLQVSASKGQTVSLYKYAAVASSFDHPVEELEGHTARVLHDAVEQGFDRLLEEHIRRWNTIWDHSDITIEGDVAAQQGIRFNIFQLNQTYTGEDERLNIGPKGFTGEKYGGSTYWDTEAYCLPFYLNTADSRVARNLLKYRYKHLPKAIENAEKLGFEGGAALYPMVTMNGEECHNEWEITFEEIHRNGAIAYAIYNYIRHTGDTGYLAEYGLEVLIGISRFWSQRVNWSEERQQYVMLGVTGPNEYENNVHNNWYTNYIATWTMRYTLKSLETVAEENPRRYREILESVGFDKQAERTRWKQIIAKMYYPESKERGIVLQQDGYLDKEQITVGELDPADRPLNQTWSWDRILRSCFIKQADVLQGMYFFEDEFDEATIRRNFDFYESRTVHESSLSPCVHVVLASSLQKEDKAYDLYLRTARLDLDDYNNEIEEGCHITSMAGTWMAIVEGFAGKRVRNGKLSFRPFIPANWNSYSFKINFRGNLLKINVDRKEVHITCESGDGLELFLFGKPYQLFGGATLSAPLNNRTQTQVTS